MRGVPRWFAVMAIVAVVVALGAFSLHREFAPDVLIAVALPSQLPADGFTSITFKLHSSSGRRLRNVQVSIDDPHRASVESVAVDGNTALIALRAGVLPGDTKLHVSATGADSMEATLKLRPDFSDSVGDGTPDFLRLHDSADQAAFRRWFTLLAEAQFYRKQQLPKEIDDCASLLRYAYREALRGHDSTWANSLSLPLAPAGGEVRQYQYPFTPLGPSLFRIQAGSFVPEDLNTGSFAQFADAKTLWRFNSHFVGRDVSRARPGDLLFFRQQGHNLPFHAMIFLGPSQIEDGREPLVVYHTGAIGNSTGEIRRPAVAELINFPDPRWRPVPSNPSFLGVYRWNILQGTD
jgi:uncharacterized protein YfaT (DUF1175 family)